MMLTVMIVLLIKAHVLVFTNYDYVCHVFCRELVILLLTFEFVIAKDTA